MAGRLLQVSQTVILSHEDKFILRRLYCFGIDSLGRSIRAMTM